jgi:ubiquinone/menaquinone biosynthesis C-methylase UbiE
MRNLTVDEARAFYDRFGAKQDQQIFYEGRALATLVAQARLAEAQFVFEFGCGTGRLALDLLQGHLSPACRYLGVDISSTMVRIASGRLASYGSRALATLAPVAPALPLADTCVDRFLSTYVLDLLSETAARQVLAEARRVLVPGGLLCLAGITRGVTPVSRVVMGGWQWLFNRNPSWVGGCRPTLLRQLVPTDRWNIRSHETVVSWGVASEVLVATPRQGAG